MSKIACGQGWFLPEALRGSLFLVAASRDCWRSLMFLGLWLCHPSLCLIVT